MNALVVLSNMRFQHARWQMIGWQRTYLASEL